MRIIIVDDEMLARGIVRELAAAHPEIEVVAECANGFEAVKAITELGPDLAILDIQMPRLDGFEVAELVAGKCRIMFATAFDHDYVQIHTGGKSYLKNQRLSDLESQLDPDKFLRIHRSYLLNLECLARIEQAGKDSHVAVLNDGGKLPISRSGYQKVHGVIQ